MTKYDVRFKVNLVEHYLSGSNGYRELVSAYGIEHSQLRRWVASYHLHGLSGLEKKH
ncbi:helix-turn-helix domain-containing protein, partial [Alcaligenes aquatilis]|uniref:helix-turn-helix domain-containing protein n=1 Tax=Alcaligenes aquatilis TaxID=323284 RepID=UPI0036133F66